MEKITLILKDIEYLCKHVTKGHELCDDLQQEVILALLETKRETIEALDLEELKKYMASIVYMKWYYKAEGKNKNNFYYTFREFNNFAPQDVDEIRNATYEEEFDALEEKYYKALTSGKLTDMDKLILREYVRRGGNKSQFSLDTNISRKRLHERIEIVLEKCKKI